MDDFPAERQMEAPVPQGVLRGTFFSSGRLPAPAVLLIPGSGPVDRNGNAPPDMNASTLRLVAEGLAARGISSVRIDKRGMYESALSAGNGDDVTIADYVADAHAWVDVLKQEPGVSCVWVLGHSEGGLVALAAAQGRNDICGLVLVSTPGRKISDILREQLTANPANQPLLPQALDAITKLDAGKYVDDTRLHPALLPLFRASVQDYLMDLMKVDPARLIAGYTKPVLIVQGDKDIQTQVQDAVLLAQANRRAQRVVIPNMNHVLKQVESIDLAENLKTYSDPGLPLAEGIIDSIADFILRNAGGNKPFAG